MKVSIPMFSQENHIANFDPELWQAMQSENQRQEEETETPRRMSLSLS